MANLVFLYHLVISISGMLCFSILIAESLINNVSHFLLLFLILLYEFMANMFISLLHNFY
jgi:hypothetical protein